MAVLSQSSLLVYAFFVSIDSSPSQNYRCVGSALLGRFFFHKNTIFTSCSALIIVLLITAEGTKKNNLKTSIDSCDITFQNVDRL